MRDRPVGQLVPLVARAAVHRQTQLGVLILALFQVVHHLLHNTNRRVRWTEWFHLKQTRGDLDDFREVQSFDVVVGLEENLAQTTFAHRVVLGVELIEAVKRVAILE